MTKTNSRTRRARPSLCVTCEMPVESTMPAKAGTLETHLGLLAEAASVMAAAGCSAVHGTVLAAINAELAKWSR